ncbi:MAG: carboxypeptidase-like regulatory domain-containing protein [Blastocatellia bacterium]|nr:carboxypeptidase-like regulatory domain-containing protein [Blastocatellia bacterium]
MSATFEPEQITSGASSTLTLSLAESSITAGSYSFTIRGAALIEGSEVERSTTATLNVIAAGQTTLSGRVLSTEDEPIMGATVSLDGKTATTDAAGAFLLSGVTAGVDRPLMVDGRTASAPNRTYPVIIEPATIVAGQANVVPFIFYLPAIDTQFEVEVNSK